MPYTRGKANKKTDDFHARHFYILLKLSMEIRAAMRYTGIEKIARSKYARNAAP